VYLTKPEEEGWIEKDFKEALLTKREPTRRREERAGGEENEAQHMTQGSLGRIHRSEN